MFVCVRVCVMLGMRVVFVCLLVFVWFLHEIGHVGGHLLNLGVVERLDVVQRTLVVLGDEVDGHSLATETSTASNSVTDNAREREKRPPS